jgi:hypothetical protein
MKRRPFILLAVVMVLLSLLAYSFAAEAKPSGGNNSPNAKACQGTGYLTLYRQDGTRFANADECTSYAAHGGILVTATPIPTNTPTPTATNTPIPPTLTPTPEPPPVGCALLNDPSFDDLTHLVVAPVAAYFAGDVITVTAQEVSELRSPNFTLTVGGEEQSGRIPGTITYTVPVDQVVQVEYRVFGPGSALFEVSCIPAT